MTTPTTTEAKPADAPAKKAKRSEFLASLLDAYERARPLKFFQQWRPADLIAAGIPREWLKENGLLEAGLPAWCSQRSFAEICERTFGRVVSQAAVSRAVRLEGMAAHVTASNGRIRTAAALEWWRVNKASSEAEITSEAEHRRERQRIAREREQLELEELQRQLSDKWIPRQIAEFTFAGGLRQHHLFVKRGVEKYFAENVEVYAKNVLGLAPEIVASLKAFLREAGRQVIDDVENAMAQKSKESATKLDQNYEESKKSS
jgi:hypothetical protein